MSKKHKDKDKSGGKVSYKDALHAAQVELVKLQRHIITKGEKLLVIVEGRDGSGKDGTIKRLTEHLSPRETRIVALPKPSERDRSSWYFQRYVPHLPAAEEIVVFNRSWYNRAGVERVMGFCSEPELRSFFDTVLPFEALLRESGIRMLKYYLDITKSEQKKRLEARREDLLKQWKISPIDAKALDLWNEYSEARDEMLKRTSVAAAPWYVVHTNDKKTARLNVIRHLLSHVDYDGKDTQVAAYDAAVVGAFSE